MVETEAFLRRADLRLTGYREGNRYYRPSCKRFPELLLKVFHERDIPIQVAVGNYDLGICGLGWIEELLTKYPASDLVKVRDLRYGQYDLCAAVSSRGKTLDELRQSSDSLRLVSEYPNLAESFALKLRLRNFTVLPVWGAAERYPPESAEVVLIPQTSPKTMSYHGLTSATTILQSSAFLIANKNSWQHKDMSSLLERLYNAEVGTNGKREPEPDAKAHTFHSHEPVPCPSGSLRLALPNGHQQQPTSEFLTRAGIGLRGYTEGRSRPTTDLPGMGIKVIRPQDMPLQVANGNFDLAITGRDWLLDHLCQFPASPVRELLDLGFGRVKLVAVVNGELSADHVRGLRKLLSGNIIPKLRVASEYVSIADRYARDNRLSPYRVIPTWGATEAFLPEDADLLIENAQTGQTIARHNLKVIDTLFESSACLIGNANDSGDRERDEKISSIIELLHRVVSEFKK
jgi:ATP phosphoribosyltransferase